MAEPQLDVIAKLLFEHLLAITDLNENEVDFPSVSFTPPRKPSLDNKSSTPLRYVSVAFTPNTSELDGIAFDSGLNDTGLLGLNATWPAGQGVQPAIQFAMQLVKAFQPGLLLYDSATRVEVRIYEQPRMAPPVEGTDNLVVPVIVRWMASTPKTGGY